MGGSLGEEGGGGWVVISCLDVKYVGVPVEPA